MSNETHRSLSHRRKIKSTNIMQEVEEEEDPNLAWCDDKKEKKKKNERLLSCAYMYRIQQRDDWRDSIIFPRAENKAAIQFVQIQSQRRRRWRKNSSNEYDACVCVCFIPGETLTYSLTSVKIIPDHWNQKEFVLSIQWKTKDELTFWEADNLLNDGVATPLCRSVRVVNSSQRINHCIAFNSASNFARLNIITWSIIRHSPFLLRMCLPIENKSHDEKKNDNWWKTYNNPTPNWNESYKIEFD